MARFSILFFFNFITVSLFCQEETFLDTIHQSIELSKTIMLIEQLSSDELRGRDINDTSIELTKKIIETNLTLNNIKPLNGKSYRQSFQVNDKLISENIIGVIDNIKPLNEYIVLMANYDNLGIAQNYLDTSNDNIYNGANDNSSGCVALLQIASFLNKFKFPKKIIILFSSAKHYGNIGAASFAYFAKQNNINIKAVLNFEMLGKQYRDAKGKVYFTDNELSNLSFELNYILKEKFIVEKANPEDEEYTDFELKQDHMPFYNIYGIPSNTMTTFNSYRDDKYMSPYDEFEQIDFHNFQKIIHKTSYALFFLLKNNVELLKN